MPLGWASVAGSLETCLGLSTEALELARLLVAGLAVPKEAAEDALHIAVAAVNGMDYLLTWNCRHIANARMRTRIADACVRAGYESPVICTPEELLEDQPMWKDEVVEEVRQIREAHAAAHGHDLDRIYEDLKRKETASGRAVVTLPPRIADRRKRA